jgi:hypothetical protein
MLPRLLSRKKLKRLRLRKLLKKQPPKPPPLKKHLRQPIKRHLDQQ